MTLPLAIRNRLAELILESLHDAGARRGLEVVAAILAEPFARARVGDLPPRALGELFEERDGYLRIRRDLTEHEADLAERSGRAWHALRDRPLDPPRPALPAALEAAGRLFDAGLYFEVHELLEPYWRDAAGDEREALQGLIQIAVGFQHLANGNLPGARGLLRDGSARTKGRRLRHLDLDPLSRSARRCGDRVAADGGGTAFDWSVVPRFPTNSQDNP